LYDSVNIHGFVVGGQGQALLVFLALDFSVGKKPNVLDRALGFYTDAQRFAAWRRAGFLALNYIRSTKFGFSTSLSKKYETPAFAKRLLTLVIICFSNSYSVF
jgi:hypothetical protein